MFKLISDKIPNGDQPQAIEKILNNLKTNRAQVLLGATGTGKTFTIANIIEKTQRKTLVMAHNKTLAGQLYQELKALFPENHVEYYVSYFDFYQPEAYLPSSDTYIEKTSAANSEIEMMRLSTINSLTQYDDVIVVASVAAIYASVSRADFERYMVFLKVGEEYGLDKIKTDLVKLDYEYNAIDLKPGTFRVKGDVVDIAYGHTSDYVLRISFFGDTVEKIMKVDNLTGEIYETLKQIMISPADEYIMNKDNNERSLIAIEEEMKETVKNFKNQDKLLEAQRIEQRTLNDIESMREFGYCNGIENYSRHLENRKPGETPYTLFDFFNENNWLLVIDESHISIPQFRGMFATDKSRKQTLVDYGFRLPSALDNRPLNFDELQSKIDKVIYVSATPSEWEIEDSNNQIVQQIVRPTFLLDPTIEVRKTKNQIDDLINELFKQREKNEKTFIGVMTIRMAEELTDLLKLRGIKVAYLHNELKTLERTKILNDLRKSKYEAVVGINLLREGIDVPEVSLVAIFDADKPGLFRNSKSLIQMIGRAARNVNGHVILYGDNLTKDMQYAIDETYRRREIQEKYNIDNNKIPTTIVKEIYDDLDDDTANPNKRASSESSIKKLKNMMLKASKNQEYELAAELRDRIIELSETLARNKKTK
ncbi:MAG: excinuclease ABC subunit UvrB [Mycoplasma sp.]